MLLCTWNRICIFIDFIFDFYFNSCVFNRGRFVLQKCQAMITFSGCCCRHCEGCPSESWLLKFLQRAWKDGGGWNGRWQRYRYGTSKYGLHTRPVWETEVKIHEGSYFSLCRGGGVGGGSGVYRRMFLATKVLAPNIKQVKTH